MEHEALPAEQHQEHSTPEVPDEQRQQDFAALFDQLMTRFGWGNNSIPRGPSEEALLAYLRSSRWQERTAAARKLGEVGEAAAIGPLIECLTHDRIASVRAAAARALGELAEYMTDEYPLRMALHNQDADIRTAAALALRRFGERLSAETVGVLRARFSDLEEDCEVRSAALAALGGLGLRSPVALLTAALQDAEWQVRMEAAFALGKQEEKVDSEAPLLAALQDEVEPVAQAAAYALREIGAAFQLEGSAEALEKTSEEEGTGMFPSRGKDPPQLELVKTVDEQLPTTGKPALSGHDKREKLEPPDIENSFPVITQAFDDQWVPNTLLQALLAGRFTYQQVQPYLEYLVRTEYMRALVSNEKVIVGRTFLYNNPTLFRDFLPGRPERHAFKQLLQDEAIIPFLLEETSPEADPPPWIRANPQGLSAWRQLCQEVRPHCLRFSWSHEDNVKKAKDHLAREFHKFASNMYSQDEKQLVTDFGLDAKQADDLVARLIEVQQASLDYFSRRQRRHVVRTFLYEEFVTAGNPTERRYDGTKPFARVIKQLLDVAYNSNLADALGAELVTPVDSPTRLVLQELESVTKNAQPLTAEQLLTIVRRDTFQIMQQHLGRMGLKSMGFLSLEDVPELRKRDEWRDYIRALHTLLRNPLQFDELAKEVFTNYLTLTDRMKDLVEERNLQIGGRLMAPWNPAVEMIMNVGGVESTILWSQDGIASTIPHEKEEVAQLLNRMRVSSTRQDALCNIRWTIRDRSRSGTHANVSSRMELTEGRMANARVQWEMVLRKLGEALRFQEFSEAPISTSTLNLARTTG
jgi:hypothetical protein